MRAATRIMSGEAQCDVRGHAGVVPSRRPLTSEDVDKSPRESHTQRWGNPCAEQECSRNPAERRDATGDDNASCFDGDRNAPTFALRATVGNLRAITGERRLADQTGVSWNRITTWLARIKHLQEAAQASSNN